MAGTTTFSVALGALGPARVVVGDEDVTEHVDGVELVAHRGQAPTLALSVVAAGSITGEGIVEVHHGANADAVRDLDPDRVRALVSERCTGMADDLYAATLAVAADLLDEAG